MTCANWAGTEPPLQCEGSNQSPPKFEPLACQTFSCVSEMMPLATLNVSPVYDVAKWIVCNTLFDPSLTVKIFPVPSSVALAAFATSISSPSAKLATTPLKEFEIGDVRSSAPTPS